MRYYEILVENRIEVLHQKYDDALQHKLSTDKNFIPNEAKTNIFDYLNNADPTNNNIYTQWLINLYLSNNLKLEDVSKAKKYLMLFNKVKQKLDTNHRDINQYKTLPELYQVIEKYDNYVSGKEQKENVKQEIMKEVKVVYTGSEGKILIPLTKEASCWLGKGTQWCTAATSSDNYFDDYNIQGPLYIILCSDGRKYQFHFQSCQLMDERDVGIDFEDFDEKYPWVFDHIKFSEEEQLDAVEQNGLAIRCIRNPSEQLQLIAVNQNGYVIKYIDNPSERLQLAAVKEDGYAIKFINDPSEQLQLAAVKQNGYAIGDIKNPSEQLQLVAVNRNGLVIGYIKNPSEQVKLAAVNKNGYAIGYIKNPSEQVKLAAVKQNGYAIQYIKNPSEQIQLAAKGK